MLRVSTAVLIAIALLLPAGCSSTSRNAGPKATIVLQVDPADKSSLPTEPEARTKVMEQVRDVVTKRIANYSVANPAVSLDGTDKIVVTIQTAKDAAKIIPALTSTGTLEFYHLNNVRTVNHPTSYWAMSSEQNANGAKGFVFEGTRGETVSSTKNPKELIEKVVDTGKNRPILTGADLVPNAAADIDQQDGVVINIEFNKQAARAFRDFTRTNKGEILAIFYNGRLLTAPTIREAIPNGRAQISGFQDIAEAKRVADNLNAGNMPVRLVVANKTP